MTAAGAEDRGAPRGVRAMAIVRWALVAATGLAAVLSIAHTVGHAAPSAKQGVLYRCPMHPAIVQDHPGECPICGMTLVLVTEADKPSTSPASAEAASLGLAPVDLAPDRVQLIGMRTAKVERAPLGQDLRAVGVLTPDERGLAQISVRFSGWVQKVVASETGRRVARGDVLATIYSPEVLSAEQELLTASTWRDEGGGPHGGAPHPLATAARRRLELLGIAAPEIDALLARGKVDDVVPIRSPASGYVTARNVVSGAAVQPGAPLFEIADLARVWLVAEVFEQDAARLAVGQRATLSLAAYPGERFAGKVALVYPTVDPRARTLRVRVEFANRKGPGGLKLRPGMYGDVSFEVPTAAGLTIPSEALVDTGEQQYVFVARGGGRFEPRPVRVGRRAGGRVQITSGLAEGDVVVTTGNFLLDSESRLRAAIEGKR